jgi:hypothetical protein
VRLLDKANSASDGTVPKEGRESKSRAGPDEVIQTAVGDTVNERRAFRGKVRVHV